MNGLELSRAFFETWGRPMLEEEFPALLPYLAVGLFGPGSECFGFDDAVSRDHDFEPGFCLFLPEEAVVDRRSAFLLERAYARLPRRFEGVERPLMQPVGGARRGVFRTEEFFQKLIGSPNGVFTLKEWLALPEQALAEATNGELWLDNWGEVTRIRETLRRFPEDVRRKKLAGHLLLMEQAGQYNYPRCLEHGESGAAQLAVTEFVRSAMAACFLLSGRYRPYYKWSFRALRALPEFAGLAPLFEALLTSGNGAEHVLAKTARIETAAAAVLASAREQGLTKAEGSDLERHAYAVNDGIRDAELRNLHILAAV